MKTKIWYKRNSQNKTKKKKEEEEEEMEDKKRMNYGEKRKKDF